MNMLLRRIAADLAVWYCLPVAFLIAYVGVLHHPAAAVLPHIAAVALPFALLVMLRLVIARLISHAGLRLALSSVAVALLMGAMLTYYALVLISVSYWGGVVSWTAIPTFFKEAPDIAESIGAPRFALSAAAIALAAAVIAACGLYLKRFDWTGDLTRSGWVRAMCASAGFCILWAQVAHSTEAPWITQSEPLSMTLFPLEGTRDIEGHRVGAADAKRLDDLEDRARAAYVPAGNSAKQNLILIVVDALRPDHMSLFGYERKTTPFLDGLARTRSVRKLVAHTACGDTACGLLGLTGSKLPRDFSLHPFGIHQVLRRNGYRVHMILSGDHSYLYPMRDYYGPVDSWFDGNSAVSSMNDDRLLVDRLATMPDWDGAPTMFQFHLMSAHQMRKGDGKRVFLPAASYILAPRLDEDGSTVTLPAATNYYDNGVLTADGVIETLLRELGQKGYLRRTLVVITADHGESLGEHGIFGHANSVREEVLKVPVVFIAYGYQPAEAITNAAYPLQIDIAPTILAELNIPRPMTWRGQRLQERHEISVTYFEERAYAGLVDARQPGREWKYWVDRMWGHEFAFDLGADPHESNNVIASVPAAVRTDWRMRILYSKLKAAPVSPP